MDFDPNTFLPQALFRAQTAVKSQLATLCATYDITLNQWQIMTHLAQTNSVSVREIAALTDLDKPKISRAVAKLVAAQLITKSTPQDDKRLLSLELTSKGRALLETMTPDVATFENCLLDQIGPTNKKLLLNLLERLHDPKA